MKNNNTHKAIINILQQTNLSKNQIRVLDYRLRGLTLEEITKVMNVSTRERIRQIEHTGLKRLNLYFLLATKQLYRLHLLPIKTQNVLLRAGIYNPRVLRTISDKKLLKLEGIGVKMIPFIRKYAE